MGPAISQARRKTARLRGELRRLLSGEDSADANVVVYGSMARDEMTSESDLDWTLLLDKPVDPADLPTTQRIASKIYAAKFAEPGKTNIFGTMTFSHSLVHDIGGPDDTNANTTRRILLLLESYAPAGREAYDRVRRHILHRYVEDDYGLSFGSGQKVVPRFLLNDLSRYWRSVTVDFVQKQRADAGGKWALRNAKLRMSRKLIFAAGLLVCFECHLDPDAESARLDLRDPRGGTARLIQYLEQRFSVPPLEILARSVRRHARPETARLLFDNYDAFLSLMDNHEQRAVLKSLEPGQARTSEVFVQVREISHGFQEGLTRLFFRDNPEIYSLTEFYGVF
ncbi:MAG: nucleotidyltransferase domain-containing protein [Bryobacterales bacterium]|nr:nucleotidyltransferase domain-containing protein [Bryobacterales bacterium]